MSRLWALIPTGTRSLVPRLFVVHRVHAHPTSAHFHDAVASLGFEVSDACVLDAGDLLGSQVLVGDLDRQIVLTAVQQALERHHPDQGGIVSVLHIGLGQVDSSGTAMTQELCLDPLVHLRLIEGEVHDELAWHGLALEGHALGEGEGAPVGLERVALVEAVDRVLLGLDQSPPVLSHIEAADDFEFGHHALLFILDAGREGHGLVEGLGIALAGSIEGPQFPVVIFSIQHVRLEVSTQLLIRDVRGVPGEAVPRFDAR